MRLINQIKSFENGGGITKKLNSSQKENANILYNTLISEGIPHNVALGMLGNVMQESSLNPRASTNLYTGFAQWDKNRLPNLQKFAKDLGTDIYNPTTQAKFIAHELKNQYSKVLKEASDKNPYQAALILAEKYEVAGDKKSYEKRGQYANDFRGMFYGSTPKTYNLKNFKANNGVNTDNIHNNLVYYLNTLPDSLKEKVFITSGNDSSHTKKSRHYNNRALDLDFDKELYNYVKTDPNRLKYGITLLDPNHGSGPHLHLSYGKGTENKKDVWKDPFSTDRDWEVIDLSNEDPYNINQNTETPTLTYEEIINNRISPADIWEMYKDEPSKAAELIAFKNEYEERLQKEAQAEKQAEIDLQKQALAQAQAEKRIVQNLLTTPTAPQEDYNTQISQPQQPTQPFRFQTDWYIPQVAQKGGTISPLQKIKQKFQKVGITQYLNPKNWGVDDLSDKGSFDKAYSSARNQGLTEFLYNGKGIIQTTKAHHRNN